MVGTSRTFGPRSKAGTLARGIFSQSGDQWLQKLFFIFNIFWFFVHSGKISENLELFSSGCSVWRFRNDFIISGDHIVSSPVSQTVWSALVKNCQVLSTHHPVCSRSPWERMVSLTCHRDGTFQLTTNLAFPSIFSPFLLLCVLFCQLASY